MTEPKTIDNYGGVYNDAEVVSDPTTEMGADEGNRLLEDVAQMTNTSPKAHVLFSTVTSNDPTDTTHRSQWGNGVGQVPTVTRSSAGLYEVEYAASFTDSLDEVETVAFWDAQVRCRTGDETDDLFAEVLSVSGRTVTLKVESPRGTLADVGDQSGDAIVVGLSLYA